MLCVVSLGFADCRLRTGCYPGASYNSTRGMIATGQLIRLRRRDISRTSALRVIVWPAHLSRN